VAASGRRDLLEIAEAIGSRLDSDHADPRGGYAEPGAAGGRRRQFPQMHLFEAFQLLARLAPGRGWERRATVILDLLEHRLIRDDGGIDEWYDADWQPIRGGGAVERELGHQFEWAWLLYRHAWSAGVPRARRLADRVYDYGKAAMRRAPIGPLPNRIDAAGRPLDAIQPMWPLAELLRAAVAAGIAGRSGDSAETAAAALQALFAHYIDRETGLWLNELRPDRSAPVVPVRVLYHLVPALAAFARERESAFEWASPVFDRNGVAPQTTCPLQG
jgi:mannose/cellobiose epimerase-like protein (N-acyl-D-glucosamine 2-epimerase family)